MRDMLAATRPLLGGLSRIALGLAGTAMVAMTGIVAWQIFARYVLNDTPSWSEPLSLQLMAWFILLGAAIGVRESVHLGLDIIRAMAPPQWQRRIDLFNLGLVAAFGAAMAVYSTRLAIGTWGATIPVLGWPGGLDFFPMIAGGALIALFALERLADVALGEETAAEIEARELA